jgi:arsenate reductase (glutaredoxin)
MVTVYHNPRCTKSRETIQLLRDHGIEPRIIEYLKTPPSVAELKRLLTLLGLTPRELVRRKEPEYEKAGLNDNASDAQILRAMVEHPILLERPIVVAGDKAVIGRPPQNALKVL